MSLLADLTRFYDLLGVLEASALQGRPLSAYVGRSAFPERGVYFFREPGEVRSYDPRSSRVVRVGTHAVSANAKSTLWQRLKAHRGTRAGGGNHRGSIFRLHVGAALQARENAHSVTWGSGSSAPQLLRDSPEAKSDEQAWEGKVSHRIGAMTVLWVDVPDDPGASSVRAVIERNSIALLSNHYSPQDVASPGWLGHFSPKEAIRRSGLWNLNHTDQAYDPLFLDLMHDAVVHTSAKN